MNISLYAHGGSANHGCEALARSTIKVIGESKHNYSILSESPREDLIYGLDKIARIIPSSDSLPTGFAGFIYALKMKLFKDDRIYFREVYRNFGEKQKGIDLALAIGGDNYCYTGFLQRFGVLNDILFKENIPCALWGCSIDPFRINKELLNDLKKYRFITARESITYKALKQNGVTNLYLVPDTAFVLDALNETIPPGFDLNNTVGINLSPLLSNYETSVGITEANYENLIDYILKKTTFKIALIPHVVWEHNNDMSILITLYKKFNETGRIVLIKDQEARKLKGVIQKCRLLIAARTHASIAGYSTGVPTLVVGYSVKSRGIAIDLFGTDKNFVLPVNSLSNPYELVSAFIWLLRNEDKIRNYYSQHLKNYISTIENIKIIQFLK